MVQAENVDFELVRPIIPQVPSARSSEDSAFAQREITLLQPDGRPQHCRFTANGQSRCFDVIGIEHCPSFSNRGL